MEQSYQPCDISFDAVAHVLPDRAAQHSSRRRCTASIAQVATTLLPTATGFSKNVLSGRVTVNSSSAGVSRRRCTHAPWYATVRTVACKALHPDASILGISCLATACGERVPGVNPTLSPRMATDSVWPTTTSEAGTTQCCPSAARSRAYPCPVATTWPVTTLCPPMKRATNAVHGRLYTSRGVPHCSRCP